MKITSIVTLFLVLTACAQLPQQNTTQQFNSKKNIILENIKNIDVSPETALGNQATLIKEAQDLCQIEFTGFHQMGKVTENWTFKGNQLLSANTTKIIYQYPISSNDFLSKDLAIKSIESVPFDVTQADKIQNFTILKTYFKKSLLEQCHK